MFRLNPGCGCCGGGIPVACNIGTDSFTAADTTATPSGWTEATNNHGISGNACTTTTSGATLQYSTAHPDGESSMLANVKVRGENVGDKLRVYVAYTDANDYVVVELQIHATCGTMRIFECQAGIETQLGSDVPVGPAAAGEYHTITACYRASGKVIHAGVGTSAGNTTWFSEETSVAFTGTYAAIGNGTISTRAYFDDWKLYRAHSDTNPTCPQCTTDRDRCDSGDLFDNGVIDCRWTQVSGTWSESGTTITSSGAGELLWNEPIDKPDWLVVDSAGMSGAVTIVSGSGTTRVRILRQDGTNHLEAELTHSATSGTLKINNSGSTIASGSVTFDTTGASGVVYLAICYINGFCSAVVSVADLSERKWIYADSFTAPTGRYASFVASAAAEWEAAGASITGGACPHCPVESACGACSLKRITQVNLVFPAGVPNTGIGISDTIAGTYVLTMDASDNCRWYGEFDIVNPASGEPDVLYVDLRYYAVTPQKSATTAWEGTIDGPDTLRSCATGVGSASCGYVVFDRVCPASIATSDAVEFEFGNGNHGLAYPTDKPYLEIFETDL